MPRPSKDNPTRPPNGGADDAAPAPRRLPTWKKALLGVSGGLMVVGLALQGYAWLRGPSERPEARQKAPQPLVPAKGLVPDGPPDAGPAEKTWPPPSDSDQGLGEWSGPVFRLGLGFFLGFCVGYALRAFLKLCLVGVGLIVLALLGLQYAGLIALDWAAMQTHYHTATEWLAGQTATIREFLTGYLPSSGISAFGLFAGFRRR